MANPHPNDANLRVLDPVAQQMVNSGGMLFERAHVSTLMFSCQIRI